MVQTGKAKISVKSLLNWPWPNDFVAEVDSRLGIMQGIYFSPGSSSSEFVVWRGTHRRTNKHECVLLPSRICGDIETFETIDIFSHEQMCTYTQLTSSALRTALYPHDIASSILQHVPWKNNATF